MAQLIKEVMTRNPIVLPRGAPVSQAAKEMRNRNIGDVLVMDQDRVSGILTDRDIVVRVIAEGRLPEGTTIGEVATEEVATISPDAPVTEAVELMREKALRRLPVVEGDQAIGILSLGDLAKERDPRSALADISAAKPNK